MCTGQICPLFLAHLCFSVWGGLHLQCDLSIPIKVTVTIQSIIAVPDSSILVLIHNCVCVCVCVSTLLDTNQSTSFIASPLPFTHPFHPKLGCLSSRVQSFVYHSVLLSSNGDGLSSILYGSALVGTLIWLPWHDWLSLHFIHPSIHPSNTVLFVVLSVLLSKSSPNICVCVLCGCGLSESWCPSHHCFPFAQLLCHFQTLQWIIQQCAS